MSQYPKVQTALIDFGPEGGGTFTYDAATKGVGGTPLPSESEAWAFDKALALMNKFMFMGYAEKMELVEKYNL